MSGSNSSRTPAFQSALPLVYDQPRVSGIFGAGWEGVVLQLVRAGRSMSMGWRWTSLPSQDRQLLCGALANLLNQLAYDGAVVSAHGTPFTLTLEISSQSMMHALRDSPET